MQQEFDLAMIYPSDAARTRKSDHVTSHEAADSNRASLPDSRTQVYLLLTQHGPLTQGEIITHARKIGSPFTDSRLRSAVSEMVEDGRVEFSGFYRMTENNRRSQVWQIAGGQAA